MTLKFFYPRKKLLKGKNDVHIFYKFMEFGLVKRILALWEQLLNCSLNLND